MQSDQFRLEGAPIWMALYWPILALIAARLIHNLIQWLRPEWRWLRGLLGIATAVGGLILIVLIYRAGHWMTVVPITMPADQAAELQKSVQLGLRIGIIAVAAVWACQSLAELWRWVRAMQR